MNLVALVSELIYGIIYMAMRPLFLCISACLSCLKTAFIISYITVDLVSTAVCFHISMFWRAVLGIVSVLLFPIRVPIWFLTAIPRERLLEQCVHEIQFELENLEWERKEIEHNHQAVVKEYQLMESELAELEEEHEEAISKIERLEAELQDLKKENLHLKEIQGKGHWRVKGHSDCDKDQKTAFTNSHSIPSRNSASKSGQDRDIINIQATRTKNNPHGQKRKTNHSMPTSPLYPFVNNTILKGEETSEVLILEREIAFSRSIFSVVLSLLVGVIIFEAKERELCMPLVGALFTVVGISLKSVVRFFSTVKTKPASDAIALLSLNWFILGALTYPTLPRIANMLAPRISSITGSIFTLLCISVR